MDTNKVSKFFSSIALFLLCFILSGFTGALKGVAKGFIRVKARESLSKDFIEKKQKLELERIEELKAKAQLGSSEANYELGIMYYKGDVIPENLCKATEYFEVASKHGHKKSSEMLIKLDDYWANSEATEVSANLDRDQRSAIAEQLKDASKRINIQFPQKIDSETIIEKTVAGPGPVLKYFYTLVNYSSDQIDPISLKDVVSPNLIRNISREKALVELLEKGATFKHCYFGNDGDEILEIPVTIADLHSTANKLVSMQK